MAITLDLESSQFGVAFQGAYFRIVTAAISRQRDPKTRYSVMIDVAGYASKPQSEDVKDVDFRRYHAPYADIEAQTGDNFLAKCYAWVMAHPEYAGAVSV